MILITGGSGFLGTCLAEKLLSLGENVRILDLRSPLKKSGNVQFIKGDVRDFSLVHSACKKVEAVFNLASLLPVSRAGQMFRMVNVEGTRNVLEASVKVGVKKVVHISSSIVYGVPTKVLIKEDDRKKPIGDYGRSKLEAERLCLGYFKRGMDINIIRPRLIIGPGRLGLLSILFDWVQNNKKIYLIGSGNNRFQMIGVYDLVDACILAYERGPTGELFNIGSDDVPTVRELIDALISHAKSRSYIVPINAEFTRFVLRILDYLKATPLNVEHYLIADKNFVLDTSKAKAILGWRPKYRDVEMMKMAYDWYIKNRFKTLESALPSDYPKEGVLRILRLIS